MWEITRWKQVREPASAVVCETKIFGMGFPSGRYTRLVWSQGVQKRLMNQGKEVVGKKWAAKHEC